MESVLVWTQEIGPGLVQALLDNRPETLVLHSPGGDLPSAAAAHDAVRLIGCDTLAMGLIASAAVPIFAAGKQRACTPTCRAMVHAPTAELKEGPEGLESELEDMRWHVQWMAEALARVTNASVADWKRLLNYTESTYFSAAEMLQMGLVDEIISADGRHRRSSQRARRRRASSRGGKAS